MKYIPNNKKELIELVNNPKVALGDIDISKINDLSGLFCNSLRKDYSGIESWNVSHVSNFSKMFANSLINKDLSPWDMSKATDISNMFFGAVNFNADLSAWDLSSLKVPKLCLDSWLNNICAFSKLSSELIKAFDNNCCATIKDEKFENIIDLSLVKKLTIPFDSSIKYAAFTLSPNHYCSSSELCCVVNESNFDLSSIDVSLQVDFSGVFRNSLRENFSGFENWITPNARLFTDFACNAVFFDKNIDHLCFSNATDMKNFLRGSAFNQPLNIHIGNNIQHMQNAFSNMPNFNQRIDFLGEIKQENCNFSGIFSDTTGVKAKNLPLIFNHNRPLSESLYASLVKNTYNREEQFNLLERKEQLFRLNEILGNFDFNQCLTSDQIVISCNYNAKALLYEFQNAFGTEYHVNEKPIFELAEFGTENKDGFLYDNDTKVFNAFLIRKRDLKSLYSMIGEQSLDYENCPEFSPMKNIISMPLRNFENLITNMLMTRREPTKKVLEIFENKADISYSDYVKLFTGPDGGPSGYSIDNSDRHGGGRGSTGYDND